MRALDRKLLRDLARMKTQVVAIALVVASAVALLVATVSTYRSLRASQAAFYREQRLAHVWARAGRAPLDVAREIAALPGVTAIDARLVERAILDVPGVDEPASALLVSIPPRAGHAVNDLHLRRGRHVAPGHRNEVLLNEAFADQNGIGPGDAIHATVAGRRTRLRVVGITLSPEFVMPVEPGSGQFDDRRFAVMWIARDQLEVWLDMRGAFNDVAILLSPGADERAVVTALDRILAPWGGAGAHGRDDQASHLMLEEHIQQLEALALVVPAIFLLVSAFLVNVVLARTIATQREQIGMLKSFGYSNARLAIHYIELTILIVFLGIAIGLPVGTWLGRIIAEFYATFFRFPALLFELEPSVAVAAGGVAAIAAGLGALGSVRRVVALPPIVAMAPEVPRFRRTLLDTVGIMSALSASSRMIVRNLTKRPLRSGSSVAGMALSVTVVVLGNSSADGIDRMRAVQYDAAQREDVSLVLAHPRAVGTARSLSALPGVTRVEPFRLVPARLLADGHEEDIVLVGLPENAVLRRPVGNDFRPAAAPRSGVVLTEWTARRLGLEPSDVVSIEIREAERRTVTARIAGTVDEPLNETGYMELGALGRLLGEPETYTGAFLAIDPAHARELYAELERAPGVAAIGLRTSGLAGFREMADASLDFVRRIVIVFSIIIAFGVVYNTARIALAERSRELATLRVLGLTRGEASAILLGEIAILAMPAIPIGLALGHALTRVVAVSMSSSRMHIPVVVAPSTFAFAVLVFLVSALVSALVVRRRIDRLDLVGVLKARE